MEDAVCATAESAVTRDATPEPTITPPRTDPAKASPRTRTQSPMRDAPYPYSQSPLAAQIGGICVPRGVSYPLLAPKQTLQFSRSPFLIKALRDGHGHRLAR